MNYLRRTGLFGLLPVMIAAVLTLTVWLTVVSAQSDGCSLSAAKSSGGLPCSQVLRSSGSAWMDQGFLREIHYLNQFMGVNPSFRLCQEIKAPNAFATANVIDPSYPDGTVYFGVDLARAEMTQTGAESNFSIPAIMAHEFAHIVQFRAGVRLPTKLKELQADYIAGWFMGNRDRFSGWSAQSFQNTLQSFFEKGDYAFNSPSHHGTPQERAKAITHGFASSNLSLGAVVQQSFAYVSSVGTGDADDKVTGEDVSADREDGPRSRATFSNEKFEACMQKRIQSCMSDCVNNYHFSASRCSNELCSPSVGTNTAWASRCRKLATEN